MAAAAEVPGLTADVLAPVVALSMDRPIAELAEWAIEPVHGGMGETLGIYRVSGGLLGGGDAERWSVILKALGKPAQGGEAGDWNYWLREPLIYQSGLPEVLSDGLCAPRCFGVSERPDDQQWLWLEDIVEDSVWTLDDYGRVARGLGRFNAHYLSGSPIPDDPWLSRGWLASRLKDSVAAVSMLPAALEHPTVRRAFPPDVADWILQTWAARDHYLQILDRLPRTLCHKDVFRRNVLAQRDQDRYVLIDWTFAGEGAVGEELATLIVVSLLAFEVEQSDAKDLEQRVLAGYLDGLRDGGWKGDPKLAELGYRAAATLRFPLAILDVILMGLENEQLHAELEQYFRRSVDQVSDDHLAIWRNQVMPTSLAARTLAAELGV